MIELEGYNRTQRLLCPLEDVLDHLGAVNSIKRKYTIRTTVICLLIRAMVRHEQSFLAFSTDIWFELLGTDYYAYVRVHGVTANARQQLVAVAYLLCGFQELGRLGRLAFPFLARKAFGMEPFDTVVNEMTADLMTWGYTRKGNIVGLRCALGEAMLAARSLRLEDLHADTLDRLYREADAKITRRGLTILSYVLVRRGLLQKPLGRDGWIERKESIAHGRVLNGVPVIWREWCERWFATTTLQSSSRTAVIYRLFKAGRWFARTDTESNLRTGPVKSLQPTWLPLTGRRLANGQRAHPALVSHLSQCQKLPTSRRFDNSFVTVRNGDGFRFASIHTRRLRLAAPSGVSSDQT